MRIKTRTRLLIPLFSTFCMGLVLIAHTQDVASNDYKQIFTVSRRSAQNEPMLIPLKDAINQLKSFYEIKVAYKEGLLDSKSVPVAVTGNFKNMDVEAALKQLFANTALIYKKIGNNQFSVFESRTGNYLPPADLASFSFPISGKITASKNGDGRRKVTV